MGLIVKPLESKKGPDSPLCSSGPRAVELLCSVEQAESDPKTLKIGAIETGEI